MCIRHIKALTLFDPNSPCLECRSSDVEQHQMNILDPKILASARSACGRSRGWITQAHFNAYDGPKVIERPHPNAWSQLPSYYLYSDCQSRGGVCSYKDCENCSCLACCYLCTMAADFGCVFFSDRYPLRVISCIKSRVASAN